MQQQLGMWQCANNCLLAVPEGGKLLYRMLSMRLMGHTLVG
jgi:hypothetical protein